MDNIQLRLEICGRHSFIISIIFSPFFQKNVLLLLEILSHMVLDNRQSIHLFHVIINSQQRSCSSKESCKFKLLTIYFLSINRDCIPNKRKIIKLKCILTNCCSRFWANFRLGRVNVLESNLYTARTVTRHYKVISTIHIQMIACMQI